MRRRRSLLVAFSLSAAFTGVICGLFAGASAAVYDQMSAMVPDCGGGYPGQTPAAFTYGTVDVTPYLMPDYQSVTFPSRGDAVSISAWFMPGPSADAPAVVLAHGMEECKRASGTLLVAGMLHRAGFATLDIDLRDEGSSEIVTGHGRYGATEYRDVLGGWDWLRSRGLPASRIGLFGNSLGAAVVLVAAAEEPAVAAVWADSGYADIEATISYQASVRLRPSILGSMAVLGSRLRGIEITSPSALDLAASVRGRSVALVHGEADANVPIAEARRLAAAYATGGANLETWFLPGVGHCGALSHDPAEYARRLASFFGGPIGG